MYTLWYRAFSSLLRNDKTNILVSKIVWNCLKRCEGYNQGAVLETNVLKQWVLTSKSFLKKLREFPLERWFLSRDLKHKKLGLWRFRKENEKKRLWMGHLLPWYDICVWGEWPRRRGLKWGWKVEGRGVTRPSSYSRKFVFYSKWKEKSLRGFKQFLTQILVLFVLIKH